MWELTIFTYITAYNWMSQYIPIKFLKIYIVNTYELNLNIFHKIKFFKIYIFFIKFFNFTPWLVIRSLIQWTDPHVRNPNYTTILHSKRTNLKLINRERTGLINRTRWVQMILTSCLPFKNKNKFLYEYLLIEIRTKKYHHFNTWKFLQ